MPTDIKTQSLTVTVQSVVVVVLTIINLLIVGPGSWLLTSWIDRYNADLSTIDQRLDDISADIEHLNTLLHDQTVDLVTYQTDRDQFNTRLQTLQTQVQDLYQSHLKTH